MLKMFIKLDAYHPWVKNWAAAIAVGLALGATAGSGL